MPYCAKCGVEVGNHIKNCPLCDYPIPELEDDEQGKVEVFPEGQNLYTERVRTLKNKVFFVITSIVVLGLPILFTIRIYYPQVAIGVSYAMLGIIVIPIYTYFLLGYHSAYMNVISMGIISLFLTYAVDSIRPPVTWFYHYAQFIILGLTGLTCLFIFLYRKSRHKDRLIYVPTYIIGSIGLMSVGIDGLIHYRLKGSIRLSWSMVVLISALALCLMLLILFHGLPGHIKSSIRRRLHM